jgi:hypothetical protein
MDGPYPVCYFPVCLCEGWQSRFCCPGFLHASDVMLLERQVCIPPDAQAPLHLFVEPYEYVPNLYLRCQLRPEVFLVASQVRKQSRFLLCRIELLPLSTSPLNDLCCALLECRDNLIDHTCSRHAAEIVDKRQSFGRDVLFDPFDQS